MSTQKRCRACGKNKRTVKYGKCMECRSDNFMNSSAYSWLWRMAQRGGSNQLPDNIDDLIAVLNVRRYSNLAKGYYRENGEMKTRFNYEVGHRYPCSKGGKLIAENLVVMPRSVNRTLGDNHGEGLEHLKGATTKYADKHAFDRAFIQKFKEDAMTLSAYIAAETMDDFTGREAQDPEQVLAKELQRLGVSDLQGTKLMVSDWDKVESKFAALCGGLDTIESLNGYEDQQQQIQDFFKGQNNIMDIMSKEAQDAIHQPREQGVGEALRQAEIEVRAMEEERLRTDQERYESRVERITERLSGMPDDMKPSLCPLKENLYDAYGFWLGGYTNQPKFEKWHYEIIKLTSEAMEMDADNWSNTALCKVMKAQDTIALDY